MKYLDFKKTFQHFPLISLQDIQSIDDSFYRSQLTQWQQKGYLKKVIKSYYYFADQALTEPHLFYIANRLNPHSYISLESVLSSYNLLPEGVYQICSVTTKKTTILESEVGSFSYRHIKPELLWGYQLVTFQSVSLKVASLEKALLDYLYLNSHLKEPDDFEGLRWDIDEIRSQLNFDQFDCYATCFKSKALQRRTELFLKWVGYVRH